MIKEILTLLWILVIPIVVAVYQMTQSSKEPLAILPSKQTYVRVGLFEVLKKMFGVIIFIPFAIIFYSGAPFTETTILTGLLVGEIIAFDLMTVAFYFELEHNTSKRFYTFLFVFINFWISILWAIQEQLSLKVLWISIMIYLIFGLKHILSFFCGEKSK